MDYAGRDNFNNLLLRCFSLAGLAAVGSGFTLFFYAQKKKSKRNLIIKIMTKLKSNTRFSIPLLPSFACEQKAKEVQMRI